MTPSPGSSIRWLADNRSGRAQARGLLGDSPLCYVNVPLEPAPTVAVAGHVAPARGGATLDFYLGHLDPGSPVLPLALQILAVALTRPAVVHCAAGKDRTGLVVALVLSIIGVRDEAIVADYMVTAQNMPRINERFKGWPRYREHMAAADPELYRVQEHAIQAFLRTACSRAELAGPQERPAKETSEQSEDLQLTTTRENTLGVFSRI